MNSTPSNPLEQAAGVNTILDREQYRMEVSQGESCETSPNLTGTVPKLINTERPLNQSTRNAEYSNSEIRQEINYMKSAFDHIMVQINELKSI